MLRVALVLSISVVVPPLTAAQDDPLALLNRVAANYDALGKTTYDFEQVEIRESLGAFNNRMEQRQRIVGSGGKYRQEPLPAGVIYVFDGQYLWTYNTDRNEYIKMATNIVSAAVAVAPAIHMFMLTGLRAKSARLLRQETLELSSGPVLCQVIEVERDYPDDRVRYSPMTYWIDANRNLALKLVYKVTITRAGSSAPAETLTTVALTKATVGQPVQDSLFRFIPASDATQVERLTFGPKSPLAGNDGPDFELKGLDGKPISSVSLRGRVVLLQFAPPSDDDSLFVLEMTYRSLKDNGLTAIYVRPPRSKPDAGGESYTVPIAIDADGSAARKFGIDYTGTVLIDRLGKVVYFDTSFRNSPALAKALQKAGVW